MSKIENEIKKVIERNSKLNLKSSESRNKLVESLMSVVSKQQVEIQTIDSPQIDVFGAIKDGHKVTKDRRDRLNKTTLDASINPMSGFIKGSIPKVVSDADIEEFYSDPKNKSKPKPKKVSNKPKKLSLEEIKKQEEKKKMSSKEDVTESKPKPALKVSAKKKRGFMSVGKSQKQS